MFNGVGLTKGLSLIKIIGGLSKTLQVANQIIPLYQKAKPAISNARNMLAILKDLNKLAPKSSQNTLSQTDNSTNSNLNLSKSQEKTPSQPTFFL